MIASDVPRWVEDSPVFRRFDGHFAFNEFISRTVDCSVCSFLQCEAPFENAKLVNITPITMVYGTYNDSYWGL